MKTIVESIRLAAKAKDWKTCATLTQDALKDGKVVQWEANQTARVNYGEWMAGEPFSFKVGTGCTISWSFWSAPSRSYKVGNHWQGGHSSKIEDGGFVQVELDQFKRFFETMKETLKA